MKLITHYLFVLAAVLAPGCKDKSGQEPVLFTYEGGDYFLNDLPEEHKRAYYQLLKAHHEERKLLLQRAAVEIHVDHVATNEKKPREQIQRRILPRYAPSDIKVRATYDAHPERYGPSFEKAKATIMQNLSEDLKDKRVREESEKLVKAKTLEFREPMPVAPDYAIDLTPYPSRGPQDAQVTVVEIADFTCPNCRVVKPKVEELLKKFSGKVRTVYLPFTLGQAERAQSFAKAGHCAQKQNKFWEFRDYVFENQIRLLYEDPRTLWRSAQLNEAKFLACYDHPDTQNFVERSYREGTSLGVEGTPTYIVNGRVVADLSLESMEKAIQRAL